MALTEGGWWQASDQMRLAGMDKAVYFCRKSKTMMTRDEVLEIDKYCREHKISYKQRLDELDIRFWNFFKAKRKYRDEDDESAKLNGGFVLLGEKRDVMPCGSPSRRRSSAAGAPAPEGSYLTVEIRTPAGTAVRIQGNMTAAHLGAVVAASGRDVQP